MTLFPLFLSTMRSSIVYAYIFPVYQKTFPKEKGLVGVGIRYLVNQYTKIKTQAR